MAIALRPSVDPAAAGAQAVPAQREATTDQADTAAGLQASAAEAQAEMERLIQLGGLQHDPLRHPIRALSVHLDAFSVQAGSVVQALDRVIAAQQGQMTVADVRALTKAAGITAGNEVVAAIDRVVIQRLRWWFVGAAAGLVVAVGAGFAVGWWWRGAVVSIADISAVSEHCEDRPDGGRLCWIPMWQGLPGSGR